MNNPFVISPRSCRSGMALVIVLGMLVLVLILVIAFFSSVSVDLQSAKRYSSGTAARTLADSAVSLVISQIQDATAAPNLAWASQPGMIRTYKDTGAPAAAFKLYSSGSLRVDGGFDSALQAAEVPADWAGSTTLFTDLNKPVAVAGVNHYPILDPAAVAKDVSGGAALAGSSPAIEGCFLVTSNAATATSATQTNPVPMPVQWMYVLESGKLEAMNPSTKVIAGASPTDPIVGRIAFWTDDETSKVNINTASEGTFWDRPWTDGDVAAGYERKLSTSSPVQNEFQRYPGHPAMTCLSTVFPPQDSEKNPDGTTNDAYKARIYGVLPRVVGGGSLAGTATVTGTTSPLVPDAQRLFASVDEFLFGTGLVSGRRPLNPKDSGSSFTQDDIGKNRFFLTANSRAPEVNLFNKPRVTLWPLQANTAKISDPTNSPDRNAKDKLIAFCSTIGSGANALPYYFQRYNTFDTGITNQTQIPIPSSQSPNMDWSLIQRNKDLFKYLQRLTSRPLPGLGGSLAGSSGKYSTAVADQILTEMMDYIRSSVNTFRCKPSKTINTDAPYYCYAPFSMKNGVASGWVTGQGQIVPLVITPPDATYQTKGFGRFPTVTQAALIFFRTDKLQYVPNPATATNVPMDMPTSNVSSGNNAITVLENTPGTPYSVPGLAGSYTPPDSPFIKNGQPYKLNTPKMQAVVILQIFNPTPGLPPWTSNVRYRITGLDTIGVKMGVGAQALGFPAKAANLVDGTDGSRYYAATAFAGVEAATEYIGGKKTLGQTTPGAANEDQFYPFFSNAITLSSSMFDIIGGDITIEIYPGYSKGINADDLVQTIHMTVPSTSKGLPIPNVVYGASYDKKTDTTKITSENDLTDYNARLSQPGFNNSAAGHYPRDYITGTGFATYRGDTVRSVQARYIGPGSDFRLIAGLADVPPSFFEGHGMIDPSTDTLSYDDSVTSSRLMHSLRIYGNIGNNDNSSSYGFYANAGKTTGLTHRNTSKDGYHARLINVGNGLNGSFYHDYFFNATTRPNFSPVAPQGLDGAYTRTSSGISIAGDWDTGPASQIDGPYINKADEAASNAGWFITGSYNDSNVIVDTGSSFSPNRQISSAVSFGSLPSEIDPSNPANSIPWRTLLFCKNPAAGLSHPGFGTPVTAGMPLAPPYAIPPDHAFLDLFTMPIVEPFAISEPFSTAGKVNMNYQIMPFTYLTRDTAVRAVLKSTNMMAIPTASGNSYKNHWSDISGYVPAPDSRYTLNRDEQTGTLAGFQQRFGAGDLFRSASEICDIYLVPQYVVNTSTLAPGNPTYNSMASWWLGSSTTSVDGYKLTGDNVREQPYGHLYPRLTTKSNTFTVHVQAQSIAKSRSTPADQFVEGRDQITGEFRGSFLIERYLDPNSDSLVTADGKTGTNELDPEGMVGPYKFRVVSTKKFAP